MASDSVLRVVSPNELSAQEAERQAINEQTEQAIEVDIYDVQGFVLRQWETMKRHRTTSGLAKRIVEAQRAYNGEYTPEKLAEIKQINGSEVYARITTTKVAAASSLLRDVYLNKDRVYALTPTPDPDMPGDVEEAITGLVQSEVMAAREKGVDVPEAMVIQRTLELRQAAERAVKRKAKTRAKKAEDKVEDLLQESGFYSAMDAFLGELPKMPYAAIKGPFYQQRAKSTWEGDELVQKVMPVMTIKHVQTPDLFWMPGARALADTNVIERGSIYRHELQRYLGLEGYDDAAIRLALTEHGMGHLKTMGEDYELAFMQERESPSRNEEQLLPMLIFQGMVPGGLLLEWGADDKIVSDEDLDYAATIWWVNGHIVRVTVNPSPRRIHNYYVSCWRDQAGSPAGFGLFDLIDDLQQVCNATLRALVNNMAIASGPQVTVNTNAVADGANYTDLYPWKRWYMKYHPLMNQSVPPVSFFQPNSNAAELLGVFEKFTQIADDVSAIPRYMTGNDKVGGAGRTASGLAMMLGNASKVLQDVARSIDQDVLVGLITSIYDHVLLTTDDQSYYGDAQVKVHGVTVAIQREAERMRQIEFLQYTANPIDLQIMGIPGRATLLRSISDDLGLDGGEVVPSHDEIIARIQQQTREDQQEQQALEAPAGGPVQQQPGPASDASVDPRRNVFQQQPRG